MKMEFAQVVNKGMQRDYAMNTASQEFAYENKNIRITTTGNESFLSITNEKSTKKIEIINNDVHFWWETDNYEIVYEDGVPTFRKCTIKIKAFKDYTGYINLLFSRDGNIKTYTVEIPAQEEDKYINLSLDDFINKFYTEVGKYPYAYGLEIQSILGYKKAIRQHPSLQNEEFYLENLIATIPFNDYIVFFCQEKDCTYIYRGSIEQHLDNNDYYIDLKLLYSGDLNLSVDNPIEYTTSYESDDVQKIYWVDGINQPRIINICKLNQNKFTSNLDFVPKIEGNVKVNVEKQYEGKGNFPSGVIQYYITYYNKFGQESNAVCVTPLYNISPSDRGGTEKETQTCSFKIRIENVDVHYDNIRIYSFIRTTLDGDPIVSIVGDLNIEKDKPNQYYEIIDDNYGNINVPATDILFLGGNTISASTIEQKDNTLFLGNISSIVNNDDYTSLKEQLKNNRNTGKDGLSFVSRPIEDKEVISTDYGYAPNMDNNSKDRGFKYLEWYRFGLQFQSDTGEWGNTLWINDKQNHLRPNIEEYDEKEDFIIQEMYNKIDNFHSLAAVKFKPTDEIKKIINKYNSKYYRLVMAEHNDLTRTIKTQGVVMPTVFNVAQRYNKTVLGSPIWSVGMLANKEHYQNVDGIKVSKDETQNEYLSKVTPMMHIDYTAYEPFTTPKIVDSFDLEQNVFYKILPSASYDREREGVSEKEYVSAIEVEMEVIRCEPSMLSKILDIIGNDNYDSYREEIESMNSPHGNDVLQDIFTIRIQPYTETYNDRTEIKKPYYYIKLYRLAGKRKKTYEALLLEAASKTWQDYYSFVGLEETFDRANSYDPILGLAELPTAEDFHSEAKQKSWYSVKKKIYRGGSLSYDSTRINKFKNQYFIDANLCNMWSPNIEYLSDNNLHFRIIGNLNIENTISDYDISVENNVVTGITYNPYEANFNRYLYEGVNTGITSFPLWPSTSGKALFVVYPWSQNTIAYIKDVFSIKLKNKTFANFWKTSTSFLDLDATVTYNNISYNKYTDTVIYNKGLLYEGKYQNVLFPTVGRRVYLDYEKGLTTATEIEKVTELIEKDYFNILPEDSAVNDAINIKYSSTPHLVFDLGMTNGFVNVLPNYKMTHNYSGRVDITSSIDYPIDVVNINFRFVDAFSNNDDYELANYFITNNINEATLEISNVYSSGIYYKLISKINSESVKFSLNFDSHKDYFITPEDDFVKEGMRILIGYVELDVLSVNNNIVTVKVINLKDKVIRGANGLLFFINEEGITLNENIIRMTGRSDTSNNTTKLFLGEFYADYNPSTFMGGNTENALELNTFIPISDPTPIGETIYGFEGDTYYQQWDCLRIYPTSEDDVNKVVDVVSVMLETHQNLDGDTRKARGRADVINIRPDNMVNQINPVYSQSNNYSTSNILDKKFEDSTHPLQYWWSLTKVPNSDIDTWTGVNLTSIAELDGDKGPLNKIKRWNNQLFAFQDKAIALINFNNQTTIATQEGLPVEIQNSGKVSGHYYITTNNGCKNKWSIVESPNGLYFIDSYNKSINLIGDGIKSLSQLNLFQDWIEQKERGNIWNPTRSKQAFKGFYDPIHKEVYFADGEDCICYNELLQQFTSFYDYQDMNHMFMIDNHIYSIPKTNKLYLMFEGDDYCNLFDKQCEYYMQYKINHNPLIDKTWTNLEYRADVFNQGNIQSNEDYAADNILSDKTFDSLKIWNEYQSGELDLSSVRFNYLKEAKPRFRVWRTNIPRANKTETNKYGLDRIRNPWIMLELKKTDDTNKRMEFHDLVIKYVI